MSADSLDEFAKSKLATLRSRALYRSLTDIDRHDGARISRNGNDLISFACNDYLGLSKHPAVIEAAAAATRQFGTGAGASRLVSGNHKLYRDLEQRLAQLKQTDDAIVFGSGYLTSIGVIPAIVGLRDLIVVDELAHSCLLSGAQLSRATVMQFAHNDGANLKHLLETHRHQHRRCLILTEGVFSMDGDLAPLDDIAALAQDFDAWVMSDDAHGLGVLGEGRGTATGVVPAVALQMGTLSKAVGGYGGYLCATEAVCDLLRNRARSFVYSTGLPPGTVAAAIAALEIIANDAELVARPLRLARIFTEALGQDMAESTIVPVILGSNKSALAAAAALENRGYFVPAIRPPTVALGKARLRFAFSAEHTEMRVQDIAGIVSDLLARP